MAEWTEIFIAAFVSFFVIVDPVGLTPIYLALTQGMSKERRRGITYRAIAVGLGLMLLFGVAGETVLSTIGIGMPAFRISGGLLLFMTAIEMLFEKRTQRREDQAEADDRPDPAVFPLALPLLAGPGALTTMILLTGQQEGNLSGLAAVYAALIAVFSICFLLFSSGNFLERILRQTGINLISRLLGMLLAALAVQFVVDGMKGLGIL
ncbi:MarC family protein [Paracoccaceae bacterium GXU_MW_L88]